MEFAQIKINVSDFKYRNGEEVMNLFVISECHNFKDRVFVSYETNGRIHKHYFNGQEDEGRISSYDLIKNA